MISRQTETQIQELIDSFSDTEYIEALEEMIDRAQTALAARREELGDDDEENDDGNSDDPS